MVKLVIELDEGDVATLKRIVIGKNFVSISQPLVGKLAAALGAAKPVAAKPVEVKPPVVKPPEVKKL